MNHPVVLRCPGGYFRRVILDLGPFIADYPEQVMLAGIVQDWCPKCTAKRIMGPLIIPFTHDFPRANIHVLLSSDLLHQAIKGSFKDHLVEWVGNFLHLKHGKAQGDLLLDEIDCRIAATPGFTGLRHFKHGRRFKQWTGDDSKALMKVYLPAIHGIVPDEIVLTISSLLDFCYYVGQSDFTTATLDQIDASLQAFHQHREIFRTSG
ncbi:hypothetical protein C0991_006277, partial [Blastosporella zonata]